MKTYSAGDLVDVLLGELDDLFAVGLRVLPEPPVVLGTEVQVNILCDLREHLVGVLFPPYTRRVGRRLQRQASLTDSSVRINRMK